MRLLWIVIGMFVTGSLVWIILDNDKDIKKNEKFLKKINYPVEKKYKKRF